MVRPEPAGEGIVSLAVDGGEVVGVAAMSFFRTRLDGVETRLAIPVNVATDAALPRPGRLLDAGARERGGGGRVGLAAHRDVPERQVVPDLRPAARLDRLAAAAAVGAAAARLGRRALPPRAHGRAGGDARAELGARTLRGLEVRPVERFGADLDALGLRAPPATGATSRATPSTSTGAISTRPATTAASAPYRGRRAHRRRRRRAHVQARHLGRLSRRPRRRAGGRHGGTGARGACARGGAGRSRRRRRARRRASLRSAARSPGPGSRRRTRVLRFIGKPLHEDARIDERAGRLALHPRRLRFLLMTKLVFITQQVDPRHPALAATVPKIRALAELVDEVVVLADGAVEGVLPANCRVRTFRAGLKAVRGAPLRGGARARAARRCAAEPSWRTCARSTPSSRRRSCGRSASRSSSGSPTGARSRLLELAERASTAVTSVDERSFPFPSPKLRAIGHGIDLEEFPCSPPRAGDGTAPARARALLDGEGARRRRRGRAARRRGRDTGRARAGALHRGGSASRRARAGRGGARPATGA